MLCASLYILAVSVSRIMAAGAYQSGWDLTPDKTRENR